MRKLLAWLVVTVGIAALVRKLRRRHELEPAAETPAPEADTGAPASEPVEDDPAEELRRKLASTREALGVGEARAGEPEESVEERRAGVHEQGRAAIDEMQRSTEE